MNNICLDKQYSTTRRLFQEQPIIKNKENDSFDSILFLPNNDSRVAEGGLRTKGYFKKSIEDKPLISIITIVYNGEKYLEQTIQSVINQDYDNVEYIIIDGGSTDATLEIVKKYENQIDYWVSEKDNGISDAFNKGVFCTYGDLIGIINADDYYEPEIFSDISKLYKEDKEFIIYGKTYKITTDGEKLIKKDNKISWCMSVPFSHCSSFVSKSYYKRYGLFDEKYRIAMDVDLLMRGLNKIDYISIDKYIATQRDGGISDKNRLLGYKEYVDVSKKHFGFFKRYSYYFLKIVLVYKKRFLK